MLFANIYYEGEEKRREVTEIWKMSKIISCLRSDVILHLKVMFL